MPRPECGPLSGIPFTPPPRELAAIGSAGFGNITGNPTIPFAAILLALPIAPSYVPVLDPGFQLGDSNQFQQNAGELKYVGAAARIFQIVGQLSGFIPGSDSTESVIMAIFKNSAIAHPYTFGVEGMNGLLSGSISATDTLLLQPGDVLTLRVASSAPGITLLVVSAQISAH